MDEGCKYQGNDQSPNNGVIWLDEGGCGVDKVNTTKHYDILLRGVDWDVKEANEYGGERVQRHGLFYTGIG